MPTEFCPHCFTELISAAGRCPVCGRELETGWRAVDFDQRLIHALAHPIADVRMRAIFALGKRGTVAAIEALLQRALDSPADVVEGCAIVAALAEMPSPSGRQALQRVAEQHAARAVRRAARERLENR